MRRITDADFRDIYLPVGAMLLIDRISEVDGGRIVCEADVAGHWVFPLHFPDDPIFPGTLLVEGAGQTIAVWAWESGLRGYPRLVRASAEFRSPLAPADGVVSFHAEVRRRRNLCVGTVEVRAGDRLVATVEGSLVVLPCRA